MNARKLGDACVYLGAGRRVFSDQIDPRVGLVINHSIGDKVMTGEPLLWIEHEERGLEEATRLIKEAIELSDEPPHTEPTLIFERIDAQGSSPYQPLTPIRT